MTIFIPYDLLGEDVELFKAFDPTQHPRDARGRFVDKLTERTLGANPARTDPDTTVEWRYHPTALPAPLNGIPFAPWTPPENWLEVTGTSPALDSELPLTLPSYGYFDTELKQQVTGHKYASAGVIVVEPDGRVWLVEPMDHYGGYQHTFPKGTQDVGLSLQQTAIKEAFEETGLKVRIVGHAMDLERTTSMARYYWAVREGGTPTQPGMESFAVKLVPVAHLHRLLNMGVDRKLAAHVLDAPMPAPPKPPPGPQHTLPLQGGKPKKGNPGVKVTPLTPTPEFTLGPQGKVEFKQPKKGGWLPDWLKGKKS